MEVKKKFRRAAIEKNDSCEKMVGKEKISRDESRIS
jgi:hypothetical protein